MLRLTARLTARFIGLALCCVYEKRTEKWAEWVSTHSDRFSAPSPLTQC